MKTKIFKGVDLNNAVVHCPNTGDGEKVVEFFKSKGFDTRFIGGFNCGKNDFYGCVDGKFNWYSSEELPKHIHIFELSDIMEEEKTFPRKMLVWNFEGQTPVTRLVMHDLGEQFEIRFMAVAYIDEERYLNGEKDIRFNSWRYAKETETTQMTVEEMRQELEKIKRTKIEIV